VGYTYLERDDPSIESFRGAFFKIRRALGITAFGINEVRLAAGSTGVEHDESATGHEEVYLVLDGDGTFVIDGDRVPVAPGGYLRVDAAATRQVHAGENGIRFVVVAGKPRDEYDGRESL
jgi:uncharacterized cupin superfamily protein